MSPQNDIRLHLLVDIAFVVFSIGCLMYRWIMELIARLRFQPREWESREAWTSNHTEIINVSLKLGTFPRRKVLGKTMGALPLMPEEIVNTLAKQWPYHRALWVQEWQHP